MNNKNKKAGLPIITLNKIMKKWVKRLELNDWNIKLKITEFKRKDFRQSGDIKVDMKNKKAALLMTNSPFKNEEEVIIHELIHLLLWKYDIFVEKTILQNCGKFKGDHMKYMNNLEETVKKFTDIFSKFK
jgi:hypothetical protein